MGGIRGHQKHAARLKRLTSPAMVRAVGKALHEGAKFIQTEAQFSITNGAVSGKHHEPSKPGEAPNQDTGVLAGGIEAVQTGKLRARVTSEAPYAAALERGTSKMAARPYMVPAAQKNRKKVAQHIAKAVERVDKRGR